MLVAAAIHSAKKSAISYPWNPTWALTQATATECLDRAILSSENSLKYVPSEDTEKVVGLSELKKRMTSELSDRIMKWWPVGMDNIHLRAVAWISVPNEEGRMEGQAKTLG